jgi:DNA-binding beta-propeller fold protein YncE
LVTITRGNKHHACFFEQETIMSLALFSWLGRIFRNSLVLIFLCTGADIASAQIFTPAERPNSLYRIADRIAGPAGIVRKNAQLWVVAEDSHRVVVLSQKGRVLYSIGGDCGNIFCFPVGIALDSQGFVYIGDASDAVIRKVSLSSEMGSAIDTVAGSMFGCGTETAINGKALCHPAGVVVDTNDNLYVVDTNLHAVRKVTFSTGEVKTIAGNYSCGGSDGIGMNARLCRPRGIAIDAANNLYVADTDNSTIRKITPEGVVSTVAGMAGACGYVDGGRAPNGTSTARFCHPGGIAIDKLTGSLYVADTDNNTIRKITPDGQVSTAAGKAGSESTALGPLPGSIAKPRGIAVIGPDQLAIGTEGNEVLGINF